MQERLLPPRTISFGPYLIWQCRTEVHDEYDATVKQNHADAFNLNNHFFDYMTHGALLAETSGERDQTLLNIWRKIAESFTRSALSDRSDRLSAFSGVILAFQKRMGWNKIARLFYGRRFYGNGHAVRLYHGIYLVFRRHGHG